MTANIQGDNVKPLALSIKLHNRERIILIICLPTKVFENTLHLVDHSVCALVQPIGDYMYNRH
jgi:hypothetical protein